MKIGTLLVACSVYASAAEVRKVEPPSWWAGHSIANVRVLLTGSGLRPGRVEVRGVGLRASGLQVQASGRYAFFDLRIAPAAPAGKYQLRLNDASFAFEILPPLPRTRNFRGVSRDDAIYLIVTDRFANGDPRNDGVLHDRSNPWFYHGGDFRGIEERLAYLKDLGVTALWLTPVYAGGSKPDELLERKLTSYHGYGAVDFYSVDSHLGSVESLRELTAKAHDAGLKVIQDHVNNHTGMQHPWNGDPPTPGWLNGSAGAHLPFSGALWSLFDSYSRPMQRDSVIRGWFAGSLPDLNQDDPEVRRYFLQNSLWWVGRTGADAVRMDTVPYVAQSYWREWNAAMRREFPQVTTFGEVFNEDPSVIRGFEASNFDGLFDFPLYHTSRAVFRASGDFNELAKTLARDRLYRRPDSLITFLGLHDLPRLAPAVPSLPSQKQAWVFHLTTRGIPIVYYGDEIGMAGGGDPDNRRDFPGGWREDPRSGFEAPRRTPAQSELFGHIRGLLHLRRDSEALRRGSLTHLYASGKSYVYLRQSGTQGMVVALGGPARFASPRMASAVLTDELGSKAELVLKGDWAEVSGPGVFRLSGLPDRASSAGSRSSALPRNNAVRKIGKSAGSRRD